MSNSPKKPKHRFWRGKVLPKLLLTFWPLPKNTFCSIDVTSKCNLRCRHCYFFSYEQSQAPELCESEWLEKIEEMQRGKGAFFSCTWVGGEPLLRPDIVENGRRFFRSNRVVTNGTLPLPHWTDVEFHISIDGTKEFHDKVRGEGCYERVKKNLSDSRLNNLNIATACCLNKLNASCIEELVKEWRKVSCVRHMLFDFYTPVRGGNEDIWLSFEERDRVIERLEALKNVHGALIGAPNGTFDLMRQKNRHRAIGGNCVFVNNGTAFDARGAIKKPCVMGESADCDRCGCIVPFSLKAWKTPSNLLREVLKEMGGKTMKSLNALICCCVILIAAVFHGCGSSGSSAPAAPTLTVTKADGTTADVLAAGSATNVDPSEGFLMTFTEAMGDSVTTAENITYTCAIPEGNSLSQPTITITASTTVSNAYDVAIAPPANGGLYQYQLLACTLTVTTAVKNASNVALASNAVYTLTNGCAVADDFNADSQACWTAQADSNGVSYLWPTWMDILSNTLAFDTSSGTLIYDDTRNGSAESVRNFSLLKTVVMSNDGFQLILHIVSSEGMFDSVGGNDDQFAITILKPFSRKSYSIKVTSANGVAQAVIVLSIDSSGGSPSVGMRTTDQSYSGGEVYIKFAYTGSSVTAEYSGNGVDWTDMVPLEGNPDLAVLEGMTGEGSLLLQGTGVGTHNNVLSAGGFSVSGVTATGQY